MSLNGSICHCQGMMAQEQGDMKGSDFFKSVASKKNQGAFTEDGVEIDEDYMVYLVRSGVLADVGKGKKVDKGSKRSLDTDEELQQEWLTMEKAVNAAESDEEIQGGDRLSPDKDLSAEDSDVQGDAGEFEARKGMDDDEGEIGSDGEEDDYDPDYMEFYQHLKPHGTAYVLEIARGKDMKIVKYEDEDVSSDERKRKAPNPVGRPPRARRSDGVHREMGNLEIGRGQYRRRSKGERDKKVPKPVGRPPKARKSLHSKVERGKKGERLQIPHHSKIDKDYYLFLGGLEIFANNFVYKGKDGVEYRYDESAESASDSDSEASPKPPPSISRTMSEPSNKRRVPSGKRAPSNKRVGKDGVQYRYDESAESVSDSDGEASPKPPPSRVRTTPEPSNRKLVPSRERVPSNKSFGKDGIQCRYDESVKSESDSDNEGSPKRHAQSGKDEFRQGAMDILLKPYNEKEHEDLLEKVQLRKPIVRSHEMRFRSVEYPDERMMGKSFLDHHCDLKKKIKAVQHNEPHKALHLLRGFFFYIEHLCMENPFKPWNDDSWLEAMNSSTSGKHD